MLDETFVGLLVPSRSYFRESTSLKVDNGDIEMSEAGGADSRDSSIKGPWGSARSWRTYYFFNTSNRIFKYSLGEGTIPLLGILLS